MQGVFASGGPPVVYAVSRSIRDKTVFRSTLAAVWLSINSVLIATYVITHRMTVETIKHSAVMLPMVVLGIVIGEVLHRYINEKHFRIAIFCILIVAGLSILFQLMRGI
ncbi:MAG: TSUP family transporter [Deltaproteobacteria bacterium]|nr:TSUP family transporter [Candidatus Zymogenaceae bacterium]